MENLKKLRKDKKLTQMQLAKLVGVSLMTIRLWENGVGKPNRENYDKLMNALETIPFAEE